MLLVIGVLVYWCIGVLVYLLRLTNKPLNQ